MEFQAVVMAAGRGSRMTDLTARIAKPMLPIGNKPMVWYPIKLLQDAGFTEAIVVVFKSSYNEISRALKELTTTIQLEFVSIPDDHDKGTIDTLRLIKNKIMADLLVISGDLVTSFPLHLLADVFRTNDATMTMLLAPAPDVSTTAVPGGNANRNIERDLIGLDEAHKRVLYCTSESDLEEFLTFKLSDLNQHPYMEIHTQLVDAHLYLMKKRVLDIVVNDIKSREMTMIKGDLIPYLVRRQYSTDSDLTSSDTHNISGGSNTTLLGSPRLNGSCETSSSSDSKQDVLPHGGLDLSSIDLIKSLSSWPDTDHPPCRSFTSSAREGTSCRRSRDPVRCYAYVLDERTMCLRANTLVTYCEANRQIAKDVTAGSSAGPAAPLSQTTAGSVQLPRSAHVSADSVLGSSTMVAEKVSIKSSVIGSHCVIGERSKLINCVIMDHVNISDGATLTGCVVCERATIAEKTELKECLVGVAQTVATGKFTNEVMLERDQMMEI